ncbi:hypothetical protein [Candidatus Magnetominusculus dajiuhuensis]|uniref:hypothetical protein n=1 Tax=Candidatus Magnetominusculus dajiuhuensis TaxID=3137712 RepID=UPI003B428B47
MPYKKNRYVELVLIFFMTAIALIIFTDSAFAETLKDLERIIRTETPYPRDDIYTIPAKLPDGKSTNGKNQLYLKIAEALAGKGLIKLTTQGNVTTITPAENTTDVIRQNQDSNYVLLSISVVLGTFRMNANSMVVQGELTTVSGERTVTNKTNVYDLILKMIPTDEVKEYSPSPAQWVISRKNGQINVTETSR